MEGPLGGDDKYRWQNAYLIIHDNFSKNKIRSINSLLKDILYMVKQSFLFESYG